MENKAVQIDKTPNISQSFDEEQEKQQFRMAHEIESVIHENDAAIIGELDSSKLNSSIDYPGNHLS